MESYILEAFSLDDNTNFRYGETPDRDWKKESNIDGMRFGLAKLEAVMAQYWSYALLPNSVTRECCLWRGCFWSTRERR